MAPALARAVIESFSEPGDVVLDPFCGGGPTAVEALALGRSAYCSDLSPLAAFVTHAKARPMPKSELKLYTSWFHQADIGLGDGHLRTPKPLVIGKRRVAPKTHAHLLHLIAQAQATRNPAARRLAKLTVIAVAKNCFDCKSSPATPAKLRASFNRFAERAVSRMTEFSRVVTKARRSPYGGTRLRVMRLDARSAIRMLGRKDRKFGLVLTSPPYPGVHVLYNRWQVAGRRETDLPFRLLGYDGGSEATYTMGGRSRAAMEAYFGRVGTIFRELCSILSPGAIVAQVVAFPRSRDHLARYLQTMEDAGYSAEFMQDTKIVRPVPNRRWYASLSGDGHGPREYVLVHKYDREKPR
jgi:16S rRNA G966 N2-methylase RsmD